MRIFNFFNITKESELSEFPVDESYIANKKQDIIELNELIVKEDKFKKQVKDKIVCFNCEHNIRLYVDKGECQEDGLLHHRLDLCGKWMKRQ